MTGACKRTVSTMTASHSIICALVADGIAIYLYSLYAGMMGWRLEKKGAEWDEGRVESQEGREREREKFELPMCFTNIVVERIPPVGNTT